MSKTHEGNQSGAKLTCNICEWEKRSARSRMQYPAHACDQCYRNWKRTR